MKPKPAGIKVKSSGAAVAPKRVRESTPDRSRPSSGLPSRREETDLVDLVEQLGNAVWRRKEEFDQMIRSIRGEPEPWEVNAGRRPRRPWMRDEVLYDPGRAKGDRYVKVSSRKRPMSRSEAYDRITALPSSVLVDMFVDALLARGRRTSAVARDEEDGAETSAMTARDAFYAREAKRSREPATGAGSLAARGSTSEAEILELHRAKTRLAAIFEKEGESFYPDGTEQHRRRFFQRLIGIAENELGIDQATRKAAARRRRMSPPQARARQRQRDGIALWKLQNAIHESGAALPLPEAMASLRPWWRANMDAPAPSAKLVAATLGNSKKTGKRHVVTFIGLKLRA